MLRAIVLLVLFFVGGESLIRAGIALNIWREPLLGSVNAELDLKLLTLDTISKRESVDCIFLGSSQLDSAVNPTEFSNEYFRLTGKNLNCYNFSLGTLTAGPAGKISHLLINRYHPQLLVLGISARDFSRDFGELARPLISDPWVQNSLGNLNPSGWLLEHSFLFRFMTQVRTQFNPDYQAFFARLLRELAPDGFLKLTGNDLTLDTPAFIPKFNLYTEDLSGLEETLALKDQVGQMVFLEIPVHPEFLPKYVEGNAKLYFSKFREPVQKIIHFSSIPFIYTQEDISTLVSDLGWNDVKHLNSSGAALFSRWLAGKIYELRLEGVLLPISIRAGYGNH